MTSRTEKLWAHASWARVGSDLAARGIRCVLPWGNESERMRCESIAREIPDAIVPRHLTLEELASLMGAARCAAGVDTGLTHLCAALGVPTIGIFCASDPALTGLYGSARARNLGAPGSPPQPTAVTAALEAWS